MLLQLCVSDVGKGKDHIHVYISIGSFHAIFPSPGAQRDGWVLRDESNLVLCDSDDDRYCVECCFSWLSVIWLAGQHCRQPTLDQPHYILHVWYESASLFWIQLVDSCRFCFFFCCSFTSLCLSCFYPLIYHTLCEPALHQAFHCFIEHVSLVRLSLSKRAMSSSPVLLITLQTPQYTFFILFPLCVSVFLYKSMTVGWACQGVDNNVCRHQMNITCCCLSVTWVSAFDYLALACCRRFGLI